MRWALSALGALVLAIAALEMSALRWSDDPLGAAAPLSAADSLTGAEPAWPGVVATVEVSRGDRRTEEP